MRTHLWPPSLRSRLFRLISMHENFGVPGIEYRTSRSVPGVLCAALTFSRGDTRLRKRAATAKKQVKTKAKHPSLIFVALRSVSTSLYCKVRKEEVPQ
jgi:hypothetical protein